MKNFNFYAPTKILFGKNRINDIGKEILQSGKRVLFAYGSGSIKKSGLYDKVVSILNQSNIPFVELSGIQPNPRMSSVREGVRLCRDNNLDFILAVGGGSVIDCSKAIAAGVSYHGDAWDFMMRKAKIETPIPIGTVLTLSATGTEMNGNAVISNDDESDKRAMGDDSLRPVFSVLDPTLTYTVNEYQTSAGTVDIMSHIFEQYFTDDQGTFIQDSIAESILKTCIKYGPIALKEPDNYEARANLMWASSLALNGLTVSGKLAGDWATHDLEHQLSAINDLTHGAGLAILFPNWMEFVLNDKTAYKFAQMARNVWNINESDDMVAAKKGIRCVRDFFVKLGMPSSLSEVGFKDEHVDVMADKVCMFGPVGMFKRLNVDDVKAIYQRAL
ncbi:MAG: iron-containing alcohol dehydrogenase [Marinilabiliaceae bacterium]|nr:iron-containing alcohol dehydrogenase [Marinilabiliaceae bacterium]